MPRIMPLTPAGRGAVSSLLLEGIRIVDPPRPLFVAVNGRPLSAQPINRICFGRWGEDDADANAEDIVVCRTGAETAEIHCHGGDAATARIVADLKLRGAEVCRFDSPLLQEDAIEAGCRRALCRATTLRTADILWQQCEMRLSRAIEELATLPVAIARERAGQLLRWADFGLHLSQPWQVVLFGRPNVGKSSLINRLVGFGRSIVFDQPGTTRDVVTVETALEGWPIEFSDTAGLRADADELESEGMARACRRLESADLCLLLIDVSRPATAEDHRLLQEWPAAQIVAHKCDLPCRWPALPPGSLSVSSLSGAGLDELAAAILRRLIPEVPPPMTMLPVNSQQVAQIASAPLGGDPPACGAGG